MDVFKSLHEATHNRLVRSCHDLSEGGLAVTAAEMAFAGGLGLDLYLEDLPTEFSAELPKADLVKLFSESNSRFLIEVSPENTETVEELFADLPFAWIGAVSEDPQVSIWGSNGDLLIREPNKNLKAAWQNKIDWD